MVVFNFMTEIYKNGYNELALPINQRIIKPLNKKSIN